MKIKFNYNCLLIIALVGIVVYRLLICINYTPELCVGESNNIWNALNVANGKAIYTNPETTPFEIFQYTPLSQLPIIAAAKLFNADTDNYWYYVVVAGRLCSLIFNLLTFYLVYLLLKNILNVSKTMSLAAAVMGLGLLTHLAFAVRPDALFLFLLLLSIYLFCKAYFQDKRMYYVVCGLSFSFSFFAKQDAISILSALGFFLLIERKWKALIILAFSFFIFFIAFLFVFNLLLGDYFLFSIIGGLAQGYDIANAQSVFNRFFNLYGLLFLLGITSAFVLIKQMLPERRALFLIIVWIFSFVIALFTSVKMGSWVNYYTPFVIYTILVIFYITNFLIKNNKYKISEKMLITLVLVYLSVFIYRQIFHYTAPFLKYKYSKNQQTATIENFKNFKKEAELNNYVIFTFDKRLKLFLFKNTIFPNTEYYHHTLFSFDKYNRLSQHQQLTHYIYDLTLNNEQQATLNYYKIPISNFKEKSVIGNFVIFERIKK